MGIKLHPSVVMHPGVWLRIEIVEPHGLSVDDAAAKLHVTRQVMSNLLDGKVGMSVEMARRCEAAFGLKADALIRMQAQSSLSDHESA